MSEPTIIIVEDDTILGESFAEIYRLNDYNVQLIADGQGAAAAIRELAPRLLLLDMHLPHVSGFDILKELRADPALDSMKIVVVSADAVMAQASEALADATLLKPVTINQLLGLLQLIA
ncbi:MAG: response regulator [Anaerolineae bacterium]|nr:response regulator [Anaerolineae bacterium]MCA9909275.1 response regulator [Anaerolineae bacterium]